MPAKLRPLWQCPKCGARLVTANMWHSCGNFSLEDLFAKSEPQVRPLFEKFAEFVRRCGPVTMIPQKTRVVFMDRVRFAAAYPRKDHFVCGFMLGRRISHPRVVKIEKLGPALRGHHVKICAVADLDETLLGWLRESYEFYGRQGRLKEKIRE